MPHFFVKPENILKDHFIVDGSESHHCIHVLRKKIGDTIHIFDGEGSSYEGLIEHIHADRIEGHILPQSKKTDEMTVRLHLFQALPKGKKFDLIVEKCTELGIATITPMVTSRCIRHVSLQESGPKIERWQCIAQSASKQCGRKTVPVINTIKTFSDIFALSKEWHNVLLWEGEQYRGLKEALRDIQEQTPAGLRDLGIWIGPEGGFTLEEVKEAAMHKVMMVTLGKRILRTETAGMVTISLIWYELNQL